MLMCDFSFVLSFYVHNVLNDATTVKNNGNAFDLVFISRFESTCLAVNVLIIHKFAMSEHKENIPINIENFPNKVRFQC